jgi:multiple sugar transport system ATP-binding protein
MAEITLNEIWKRYPDGFEAVKSMDLEIRDGEFMILVGPSGCGKSTALRMIAGLEDITEGDLIIGGERVNDLAPRERDIAMVFQNYALYPHMSVRENMGFALKLAKTDKAEIDKKVTDAAQILDLEQHLERKPANLSGGQRQRVAMGRAIVRDPKVFLMDEPLSNLDAKLRVQMRTEVARIQRQLGTTMVYVTHDQTEAMTLGDRVAVMRAGVLQQVDTPANLYENPQNLFVAGFIGSPSMNFLPGRLEGDVVKLPFGDARVPDRVRAALQQGNGAVTDVIVGVRPEHFEDAAVDGGAPGDELRFRTKVDVVESMGSELYVYFDVKGEQLQSALLDELAADAGMEDLPSHGGGQQVVARLSAESRAAPGGEVELSLDISQMKFFDPSGASLARR